MADGATSSSRRCSVKDCGCRDFRPFRPASPAPRDETPTQRAAGCLTCGIPLTDPDFAPYCGPECVGIPPLAPEAGTPTPGDEALKALEDVVDFAYEHGYHEHGYPLVESVRDAFREALERADRAEADAKDYRADNARLLGENARLRQMEAIATVERGIPGGFPEAGLLAVGQALLDMKPNAALGAALREALATVPEYGELRIRNGKASIFVGSAPLPRLNDATRALSALLHSSAPQTRETT